MGKKLTLEVAFGQELRAARNKCGLSQEKLALESGLDRTYISLMERGLRQPSLRTLFVLSKALNINPGKLVESINQKMMQS